MNHAVKLGCLACGSKFYVVEEGSIEDLLQYLMQDEEFLAACPFCEQNTYVVILQIARMYSIFKIQS